MAKSKKAAPKKSPNKKPLAKKASKPATAKKAAPKKLKPTAKTKSQPKAKLKPKSKPKLKSKSKPLSKAKPSKATVKSKSEDVILHQAFMDSLAKLENYWNKQATTLKKELDALINKQEKALLSKTPKQVEKARLLEAHIITKQEAFNAALLATGKFNTLGNIIAQFEEEWSNQTNPENENDTDLSEESEIIFEPRQKEQYKPKTAERNAKKGILEEEWEEVEESEDESEDLEDIFMPQDDLSEFEVIEDFSVTNDDDLYEEDES